MDSIVLLSKTKLKKYINNSMMKQFFKKIKKLTTYKREE